MAIREFFHATKVVSGAGCITQTSEEAVRLGAKKALIITDGFLAASPIYAKVTASLEEAGVAYITYDKVRPNPRTTDCDDTCDLAKAEQVDLLIGLGGGSSMDQAKTTAALVTNGGKCVEWDYVELPHRMLPTICIPTTAGTGSEVTFCAVITDEEKKYKMSVMDVYNLRPDVAIADPELLLSLPPSLTASTGVDALTHAIEAYTCTVHQPLTDALALHAIELIGQNLVTAVEHGDDLAARENMLNASLMAGAAFINSNVGAVHAISETIGAWYDTPHGVGNSMFLPYIMEYNIPACPERFAKIAVQLGIDAADKTEEELALEAVAYVKELNARVKIPKLRDLEYIKEENFEAIAQRSADNPLSDDNARPIDKDGYMEVLRKAYGDLSDS